MPDRPGLEAGARALPPRALEAAEKAWEEDDGNHARMVRDVLDAAIPELQAELEREKVTSEAHAMRIMEFRAETGLDLEDAAAELEQAREALEVWRTIALDADAAPIAAIPDVTWRELYLNLLGRLRAANAEL